MTDGRAVHDFEAFEPLLWRVLGSLARHGFVAPPLDARDIIHDFYVDAWSGVNTRHDAGLGDFKTYLASSFFKFARRRIVAIHGWRHRLVDIDLMADEMVDERTPQRIVEHRQLTAAIQLVLKKLPSEERSVLDDYLKEARPSERTIAKKHSLTRYALRERLLNALGRIAVEMGRIDGSKIESLVAFYIWHEGRSPKNVCELVGLPLPDVHRCKSEFASQLLLALRGSQPAHAKQEGKIMSPLETLRLTLLTPGDTRLLKEVQAGSLNASMDDIDSLEFSDEECKFLDRNAEWVATVYSTLAGAESPEDEGAVGNALLVLRQDAEREIGEAFVNLLQRLEGSEFSDWERYFGPRLTPIAPEDAKTYLSEPSFVQGTPGADLLASFGLTPLMFYDSIRGIELLLDVVADTHEGFRRSSMEACFPELWLSVAEQRTHVPGEVVVSQLETTPGIRPQAVHGLAHWIADIVQRVPHLICGYDVQWNQGHLEVRQLKSPQERFLVADDVVQRWSNVAALA